jgi:hypothetical protein
MSDDDPWGLNEDDGEDNYKKIAEQNIIMEQFEHQKKLT